MTDYDFLWDNYESRKVDRHEQDDMFISTAEVTDSTFSYETGICHPLYNDHKVIVVENYRTRNKAIEGHAKWVKIMTSDKLPESLRNVSQAKLAQVLDALSSKDWRIHPKNIEDQIRGE